MRRFRASLGAVLMLLSLGASAADLYRVAVYYFPGWKDGVEGFLSQTPWEKIKPYPEREPLLGWYDESKPSVMSEQLGWMRSYGINYVIFDWYWKEDDKPFLEHAINNYLRLSDRKGVGFAILWANHNRVPVSRDQFRRMVSMWVDQYFSKPEYMREQGMPMVYLFSPDLLEQNAKKFGSNTSELLADAQQIAKSKGLPGIYFVGNSATGFGDRTPAQWGFSALTGYVYRRGFAGKQEAFPRDYADMDQAYRRTWSWIGKHVDLPYFPVVAHGWDMRPWGGKGPQDECCVSSAPQFQSHVSAALDFVDQNPAKTKNTLIVCCWNEFAEGNYIEPTKRHGFAFLAALKSALTDRGASGRNAAKAVPQ